MRKIFNLNSKLENIILNQGTFGIFFFRQQYSGITFWLCTEESLLVGFMETENRCQESNLNQDNLQGKHCVHCPIPLAP